jgi:hypothetical protein
MFDQDLQDEADDEWVNENIVIYIKDNTPDENKKSYGPS